MYKRKIAFLILGMKCGGSERAAASLCNHFASVGADVTLFVLTGTESFYPLDSKVNAVFLNSELPSSGSLKRLFGILSRAFMLRKKIKEAHPDVLIGMSCIMSVYAYFCTFFTKIKAVGTERSNPYEYMNNPVTTFMRRAGAVLCDGYVHQTHSAMEFFPKCTHKKSAVIQNAVFNTAVYDFEVPKVREKTVTTMGRLIPEKGFDVLIEAFSAVSRELPEYKLVIMGEGPLKENLKNLAKEKGLEDRVIFTGAVSDAVKRCSESSLFVLSSRSEGMPNALLEAMACGVPCVSTDCRMGPSELIENEVNGLLVPVDDAEAMAQAMLRILKDKELSEKLSSNALKIRETYSLDSVCKKWLSYLSEL